MLRQHDDTHDLKKYPMREIIRRMWPLIRPHRWRLLLAGGLVTVCGLAVASMPIFTKYVIDRAIPRRDLGLAATLMGAFLVLQLVRLLFWYLAQVIITRDQEVIVFRMRSNSFRHLQRLCLRFHGKYPSGFLHDRIFIQAICRIGMLITYVFSQLSLQVASLVFALAVCLWLSVPMTGVILAGAVGYVFVARFMGPRIRTRTIACSECHSRVCGYIMDRLQGNKTIQAHALEDLVEKEFDEEIWSAQAEFIRAKTEGHRLQLVTQALGVTLTAAIHVLGVYAIFNWQMKIGTLVAFLGYQAQLVNIISQLTLVSGEVAAARTGFDRLFTVMDTRSTVADEGTAELPERFEGKVELREVTFAYEDEPALRDVSFTVPAGQSVALVGRSGAGKTTVTNLLIRFYDPNSGSILVDGGRIDEYPLRAYRARLGVVLQEPFLFDDTVEGNLRCVRPGATRDEVREALRLARALEFVEALPEGPDSRVGERGGQLSGGQRQRIAIARTLLLDPDILILDEATSALDNESEALIQEALDSLFKSRTAFIIAHRLSTIRNADRILVFDRGRIVEDGTFDELLAKGGLFHHLHSIATSTSHRRLKLEEAGFA